MSANDRGTSLAADDAIRYDIRKYPTCVDPASAEIVRSLPMTASIARTPIHPGAHLAERLAEQLAVTTAESIQAVGTAVAGPPVWTPDGEAELHKIPFFVRGKVRRNTEAFASERGLARIDAETLYDAKAHFSR